MNPQLPTRSSALFVLIFILAMATIASAQPTVAFLPADLSGYERSNPTSLEFGPDGRLYVSTQSGFIEALTIERTGPGDYRVLATETIHLVREIPNHNDDATPHAVAERQVTGILTAGTPANPVLYVTSSDYRIGGKAGAADTNLDTNSGILSRLTRDNLGVWSKLDLVRGLPRSEESHSANGLAFDPATGNLLVTQGGNTNAGAPSNNFAFLSETALSAAILTIDLAAIDAMPVQGSGNHAWIYDLPTLDDPDRPNLPDGSDPGDPFGGNDGLNQAKLVPGGPVQIYSPGFRTPYDIVVTENGRIYVIDNAGNQGWGGTPIAIDPSDPSTATNDYDPTEPGSTFPDANGEQVTNMDTLHHVTGPGYYAGHPNPIRANPAGAGLYTHDGSGVWRTSTDPLDPFPLPADWPPVPLGMANPIEGDFQSGNNPNGLKEWGTSTNGIDEYTASNFGGAMTGNLLFVSFGHKLQRLILNESGTEVLSEQSVASHFGNTPLDVTAQGDDDPFPGTIWVACYGAAKMVVFEPVDYEGGTGLPCVGFDDPMMDEDGDGYNNADEIANGTDPCNPASIPPDFDADFLSDLWDDDDDNDGIPDIHDPFQRDAENGAQEHLPIEFEMLNGVPGYGYAGVGFTGWMIDHATDYLDLYREDQLIVGGASGIFTINNIDQGDAWLSQNNQRNAFQFGLNIDAQTGPFYLLARLNATNLFQPNPQDYQSAGFYIGNGDQDNYLRISAAANGGSGGIEVFYESGGTAVSHAMHPAPEIISATQNIDLYLSIDPVDGSVLPSYAVDGGPVQGLDPLFVQEPILDLLRKPPDSGSSNALAVGLIATSNPRELGAPSGDTGFTANWDLLYAYNHDQPLSHQWQTLATSNTCEARMENGLTALGGNIVLIGGRGLDPVQLLDLGTRTWSDGAVPPIQLHHFQAVAYEGMVYVMGAFTDDYPDETPADRIHLYDPLSGDWHEGPLIPIERRRGATGAALLNGKIYLAGGSTHGHGQGVETTVPWFDVYDPVSNTWSELPDAPHARDHAQLVEAGGKLYFVGGRIGGTPGDFFSATVPEVDVYDPGSGTWSTLNEHLPTPRAGVAAARLGPRVVVTGGESGNPSAHDEVEAFHIHDGVWESLPSLIQGRHGTGLVSVGDTLYTVAGAGNQGGSPLLNSVELFSGQADPENPMETINPGMLVLSEQSLSFGELPEDSSATELFRITNTGGNQAIVIENITIAGDGDFELDQPYNLPFVLAPDYAIEVGLRFNATGDGSKNADVTVSFRNGETVVLNVSGSSIGDFPPPGADFVRINVGGPQYVDALGQTWLADMHNVGGTVYLDEETVVTGTNDPELFHSERYGMNDFGFRIPLDPGQYDVRIHLAETYWGVVKNIGQDQAGKRVFSVFLEGEQVLADYDIWDDVGPGIAVTQTFQDITVDDGMLDLTVDVTANNAKFNAIEVVPAGTPGTLPPAIRINSGGPAYTDSSGVEWQADAFHSGTGEVLDAGPIPITGAADPSIYRTERWGGNNLAYTIPVVDGEYQVRLHFAELWWGVQSRVGQNNTGERVFSVYLEGNEVLTDYDIWDDVGEQTAVVQVFDDIAVSDGALSIGVDVLVNNAKFSAIEIIPKGSGGGAPGVLGASPLDHDFGTLAGGSESVSITVNNTGDSDLTISSATFSGDATAFTHNLSDGTTIAAGGNVIFDVTFAPPGPGLRAASLDLVHTGANSPYSISFSGSTAEAFAGIRINVGGPELTTSSGTFIADPGTATPDDSFTHQNTAVSEIAGTEDDALYRTERSTGAGGSFSYAIEVPLVANYQVVLHFAEVFYGVPGYGSEGGVGSRVFNVQLEGDPYLTAFDLTAAAGSATAYTQTAFVEVLDGVLNLTFSAPDGISRPTLSALEVLPATP